MYVCIFKAKVEKKIQLDFQLEYNFVSHVHVIFLIFVQSDLLV